MWPSLSDPGGGHGHHAGPARYLQKSRGPWKRYQHDTPHAYIVCYFAFPGFNICNCKLPSVTLLSVQSTCVGTPCPPCLVLPELSADTATLTSRYCPSCSLDRLLLRCLLSMKLMRRIGGPSMTSAPSCQALCSRCVRETPWGVKAPLCPVCHNR